MYIVNDHRSHRTVVLLVFFDDISIESPARGHHEGWSQEAGAGQVSRAGKSPNEMGISLLITFESEVSMDKSSAFRGGFLASHV